MQRLDFEAHFLKKVADIVYGAEAKSIYKDIEEFGLNHIMVPFLLDDLIQKYESLVGLLKQSEILNQSSIHENEKLKLERQELLQKQKELKDVIIKLKHLLDENINRLEIQTQKKYIDELQQKYAAVDQRVKDLAIENRAQSNQVEELQHANEEMAKVNLDLTEENEKLRQEKVRQAQELEQLKKELQELKSGKSNNSGRVSVLSIQSSPSQQDLLSPTSVSSDGSSASSEVKNTQQSPLGSPHQRPLRSPYSSLWKSRLAEFNQQNGHSPSGKKPLIPRTKGKGVGGAPA